ncbi:related to P.ciliare possible apospory-associated protein [Cephalotrichum gorgonifer]|uniref:Glucose-6-phosphate 1-epimerase n=1 Tax=Cephalotrichum gorgonifer TaxID=2041049 RepID=A0AAE8MXC7_9PEZI|nr:related to P.ciliare possible apospory-associated protein [Cephalotrichum gorgonifer]
MDRPNRPAALASTPGQPESQVQTTSSDTRVSATLPTGDSVEVLLYGATVTSWKTPARENLFVSSAAILDGSKPVRGGIPLVFPVFGPAPAGSKLPQHGFARNVKWEFLGKSTSEGESSVKLDFGLSWATLPEDWRTKWEHKFGLVYSVTLAPGSLSTALVVSNEGDEAFEFQSLLHTYLSVDDIQNVQIAGLDNSPYIDKVPSATAKTQSGLIAFSGETDRVYSPPTPPSDPVTVQEGGKTRFRVVRDNLPDVVVWNPWVEKAAGMGDFEPKDGWKNMVCVEAGSVSAWTKLEKGDVFEGAQTIYAE